MTANFTAENGKVYLVRCPKCERENYAPAVASGVCVWCGHDANKDWKHVRRKRVRRNNEHRKL